MRAVNNHHDEDDFRRAAGLRDWEAVAAAAQADAAQAGSEARGRGLFEVNGDDPARRLVTNVRKIAGRWRRPRAPGSVLIGTGGWLLALLGAGLFLVSFTGQYQYIFTARHGVSGTVNVASAIESAMFDLGMVIFTVLALGLARAGMPARTERALILACSAGSAGMNYAAADTASPRSVIAYTAAPVFLAVVVDRVVAVIRRHRLGAAEPSPWAPLGRFAAGLARVAGLVLLYLLRLVLDPAQTVPGLRRVVLLAAPLPAAPVKVIAIETEPDPSGDERPGTKKALLLDLYRSHPDYGQREAASRVAAELAGRAGFKVDAKGHSGSARQVIYDEVDRLAAQDGGTP